MVLPLVSILLEFIVKYYSDDRVNLTFIEQCNSVLERESSAYRFVRKEIAPITSERGIQQAPCTGAAEGMCHALMDQPNLEPEDARFMVVACSGFINYLKSKLSL